MAKYTEIRNQGTSCVLCRFFIASLDRNLSVLFLITSFGFEKIFRRARNWRLSDFPCEEFSCNVTLRNLYGKCLAFWYPLDVDLDGSPCLFFFGQVPSIETQVFVPCSLDYCTSLVYKLNLDWVTHFMWDKINCHFLCHWNFCEVHSSGSM